MRRYIEFIIKTFWRSRWIYEGRKINCWDPTCVAQRKQKRRRFDPIENRCVFLMSYYVLFKCKNDTTNCGGMLRAVTADNCIRICAGRRCQYILIHRRDEVIVNFDVGIHRVCSGPRVLLGKTHFSRRFLRE